MVSSIEDDGDASAWPPLCFVDDVLREGTGLMQTKRKEVTQGIIPKDPPAAPDHTDRTAGGFGGAASASLDLYG